jgi:hypothetical protein
MALRTLNLCVEILALCKTTLAIRMSEDIAIRRPAIEGEVK